MPLVLDDISPDPEEDGMGCDDMYEQDLDLAQAEPSLTPETGTPEWADTLLEQRDAAIEEAKRLRTLVGDESYDAETWRNCDRAEVIRQANDTHAGQLKWMRMHDERRDERDALAAELSAARPVVEAAKAYAEARYTSGAGAAGNALVAAVDALPPTPESDLQRHLAEELKDPEFAAAYERAGQTAAEARGRRWAIDLLRDEAAYELWVSFGEGQSRTGWPHQSHGPQFADYLESKAAERRTIVEDTVREWEERNGHD